jgi:enediyne biosynthesis protein E4
VIVTELPREIYGVYHNDGDGSFSYRSLETGFGMLSSGSSGWGVGLEDFDNDGLERFIRRQGHVLDNVEQIDPSLHYLEPPLLAMNHNGRFERVDSGSKSRWYGGARSGFRRPEQRWLAGCRRDHSRRPSSSLYESRWKRTGSRLTLRGTRSNRDGLALACK